MNKKENLKLINKNISSEDAINIAKSNNMFGDAFNIGESFYPYFHFQVNYQAPFLLARKQLKIDCLIDGLNGQAATSDIFLLKNIEAYSDDILNKKVNRERAQISGKRYVINRLVPGEFDDESSIQISEIVDRSSDRNWGEFISDYSHHISTKFKIFF